MYSTTPADLETVLLKTPKTSPAKLLKRSVFVKTDSGLLRRNRSHLYNRSLKTKFPRVATPPEFSTLQIVPRGISEDSQDNSREHLAEQVEQS